MVIVFYQWIQNFHNNDALYIVVSVKVFSWLVLLSLIVAINGANISPSEQQQSSRSLNLAAQFHLKSLAVAPQSQHDSFPLSAASLPMAVAGGNDDHDDDDGVDFHFCMAPCACLGDYFECKKQNLRGVPPLPQWVRNLELTGNKLDDSVEESIGNLPSLISLNLKKNHLTRMPQFKGLVALEKLNLAHNRIQTISRKALQVLPELRELDLMKNRIKTITVDTFPSPNQINLLNLNGNQIEYIAAGALDALDNLVELHLSHNQLRELPNELFKSLNVVKKLDLSHNQLNISWAIFKGLKQLRLLKLRSNGIDHLPDAVFQALGSIASIELDSNRLTNLSRSGFFNLTTLTALSLSNNTITKLEPDTWEFVQQLVALDLSFNNLSEVARNNFKCLAKLKKLHLQYNSIKYFDDGSLTCLTNIEYLDLSGNRLSATIEGTPGPFAALKKLQTLELKFNDVKSINKKAFLGLDGLVSLNLNGNNITTIQFNAFEPLKRLNRLVLNSTHFLCDCKLQWLYGWLSARRMVDDVALQQQHIDGQNEHVLICDYPPEVRGKSLISLRQDEDFLCNESPKPRLIKEPANQLAIKGTNVTLECAAISSKAETMSFQWRRDNFDLKDNETETRIQEMNNNTIVSSFLHLIDMNREHNGKYQCIVSNNFGSAYSQRFKITVASYPGFRRTPTNVTLKAGNTARLDCSAYGEPMPQIAWQKDGGNDFPAARERRMHVMTADDAFFIINAKPSDMGVYTCTAENPAGIIKANATLTVHEMPAFIKTSDFHHEIIKGKSFVLDCFVQGSPWPEISWYKDDQLVSYKNSPERYYFAADRQLLIVTDADYVDAGVYKCKIKNELGAAVRQLTVKAGKAIRKAAMVNSDEMTGIIVITIFCCTITTSIIWLLIICHTKKGNECNNNNGIGPHITQSMNLQSRFRLQQQNQAANAMRATDTSAETAFHHTLINGGGGSVSVLASSRNNSSSEHSEPINSNVENGGDDLAMKRYRNTIDDKDTYEPTGQQQMIPLIKSASSTLQKPATSTFQSWPATSNNPPTDINTNDQLNNVRRTTSLHNSIETNGSRNNSPLLLSSCPIEQTLPLIKNSDSCSSSSTSMKKIGLTNNSRDTTNNSIHSTVNLSKNSCSNLMNNSNTTTTIPERRTQV